MTTFDLCRLRLGSGGRARERVESTSRRRQPSRRLVLAAAVAGVTVAASLLGGCGFGSSAAQRSLDPPLTTTKQPLGGGWRVSLAVATAALGRPLVLPDTPLVSPADAGPVWMVHSKWNTAVAVTFPAAGLWIEYQTGVSVGWRNLVLEYEGVASWFAPNVPYLTNLNGVPAVAEVHPAGQTSPPFTYFMFTVAGVSVKFGGHYDLQTIQAIAQSIVDRSETPPDGQLGRVDGIQLFNYFPPARQIDLADASATLGAPVVLPDTPFASASDAGPVWAEHRCPGGDGRVGDRSILHACWIWVSFPSTGLTVGYLRRPGLYARYGNGWKYLAMRPKYHATIIELGRVNALASEPGDPFPSSIEFNLDGTGFVVAGGHDLATLRAVAQSIVDRSK